MNSFPFSRNEKWFTRVTRVRLKSLDKWVYSARENIDLHLTLSACVVWRSRFPSSATCGRRAKKRVYAIFDSLAFDGSDTCHKQPAHSTQIAKNEKPNINWKFRIEIEFRCFDSSTPKQPKWIYSSSTVRKNVRAASRTWECAVDCDDGTAKRNLFHSQVEATFGKSIVHRAHCHSIVSTADWEKRKNRDKCSEIKCEIISLWYSRLQALTFASHFKLKESWQKLILPLRRRT